MPLEGHITKYSTPEYYGTPATEFDQVCMKSEDVDLLNTSIIIDFSTSSKFEDTVRFKTCPPAYPLVPINGAVRVKEEPGPAPESMSPARTGQFEDRLWDLPQWQAGDKQSPMESQQLDLEDVSIKADNFDKSGQSDSSSHFDESDSDDPSRQEVSEDTLHKMHELRGHEEIQQDYVSSVLSPMKRDMVERIMKQFWIIFNQSWTANVTSHTGHAHGSSASQAEGARPANGSLAEGSRSKRKRDDDEDQLPSGDGDKKRRTPKGSSKFRDIKDGLRFACPFNKHDPRMYNIYSHRACASRDWDSISRVKYADLFSPIALSTKSNAI
jgi:hypothetical protein